MKNDLDIINIMIDDIYVENDFHERMKLHLNLNKHEYAYYINDSLKYKNKLICLIAIYKEIKMDLLSEIAGKLK